MMNPTIKSIKVRKNGAIDWSLPIGKFSISVERTSYEESQIFVYVHDTENCHQIVQYEYEEKHEANQGVFDMTILLLTIEACRNHVGWTTARRANISGVNDAIDRLDLPPFALEELLLHLL